MHTIRSWLKDLGTDLYYAAIDAPVRKYVRQMVKLELWRC